MPKNCREYRSRLKNLVKTKFQHCQKFLNMPRPSLDLSISRLTRPPCLKNTFQMFVSSNASTIHQLLKTLTPEIFGDFELKDISAFDLSTFAYPLMEPSYIPYSFLDAKINCQWITFSTLIRYSRSLLNWIM